MSACSRWFSWGVGVVDDVFLMILLVSGYAIV